MTTIILAGGFIFWSGIAFFACKKSMEDPGSSLFDFYELINGFPGGLVIPVILGYLLGIYFLYAQIQAIAAKAGLIGPHWLASVLLGMFASVCLAGLLKKQD